MGAEVKAGELDHRVILGGLARFLLVGGSRSSLDQALEIVRRDQELLQDRDDLAVTCEQQCSHGGVGGRPVGFRQLCQAIVIHDHDGVASAVVPDESHYAWMEIAV